MVNNSDQTFFTQLIIWTVANGISMISVWALLASIARSPKVRSSPFNLYLVFCLLPDAYKNAAGFAANLANMLMPNGSPNACQVIGFNDAYWWTANLWMSFSVLRQLHRMLRANKRVQRYQPPKLKKIVRESTIIHIFSIVMASLTLIPVDFIPKAVASSNCEAYPEPDNTNQLIFYWAFYMPVTTLIPTLLVTGICIHIWWKKLMPPKSEKSRSLLFYFARLLVVIYLVVIVVIVSTFFHNWVQAIAFMIFNLVGLFQVILALFKKDVRKAWVQLWKCQSPSEAGGSRVPSESTREAMPPDFTAFQPSTSRFKSSLLGSLLMSWSKPVDGKGVRDENGNTEMHKSDSTGENERNELNEALDVEEGRPGNTVSFAGALVEIDLSEGGNERAAAEQARQDATLERT
ncbi:hypothetical protein ACHAXT_010975 [Thalassiosira profunda]